MVMIQENQILTFYGKNLTPTLENNWERPRKVEDMLTLWPKFLLIEKLLT